ncbi:hypothetical protein [Rheinheimera sp. MMS21-TC3]|uniref:hypothetical protein n=1 Tax=Rheinheimera sp. MMS21-TC3 TaxID=3072790 RepID=UPI0028C3BA4A|nr:hypothetical protein [Rheinheimera sp. MMS21-TC3]WNO59471.1 hypothetical protein RDV63_00445 [Rheinheimera sp. MMS21-TC3]
MYKFLVGTCAIFILVGCEQKAELEPKLELTDMCPALPAEIASQKPKYKHYVTVDSKDGQWQKQYTIYQEELEKFESKYSEELAKVEEDWNRLQARQSPSQIRFYGLISTKSEGLLEEVKSACWVEVMKINEYEKDNLCNKLTKTPTPANWDEIYSCTVERSEALKVEFL